VKKSVYGYLLVAAVFLLTTLPFLGRPPLFDPDEGYYPETAREMIESGNWFDPVFNCEPRWGKPIAFYLADCLSFSLFGISEWSARLPSLVAGLGLTLLTMGLGKRLYGGRNGLYAGLIAASALQPVVYSRAAVPDMLLSFLVALSLYGFVRGAMGRDEDQPERPWLYLAYAGSALAFLSKGPLGVILPAITVLLYFLLSRKLSGIFRIEPVRGLFLFLLIAAPWFIYMTFLHGSTFLEEIFIQRNLIHYFTEKWQHPGPVYYYLPVIFAGAFPWSLALVWGATIALRSTLPDPAKTHDMAEKKADLLLVAWFFGMLIFFSLSRGKLPNYVLPLYPAVALLAARCLVGVEKCASSLRLLALLGGTSLTAGVLLAAGSLSLAAKLKVEQSAIFYGLSPLVLIFIAGLAFPLRKGLHIWLCSCLAGMVLLFALASGSVIPKIDSLQAVKVLSLTHYERLHKEPRLAVFKVWPPSFLFYTGRQVIRFNPDTDRWDNVRCQGVQWVLTSESALNDLRIVSGVPPVEIYRKGDKVLVRLKENDKNSAQTNY